MRQRVLDEEILRHHYTLNSEVFESIGCQRKEIIDTDKNPEDVAKEVHAIMAEATSEIIHKQFFI